MSQKPHLCTTVVPAHEIYVDQTLNFTIQGEWQLPIDYQIYTDRSRSPKYITITGMVNEVEGFSLCCGISVLDCENWNHLKRYVLPKTGEEVFEKSAQQEYIGNVDCEMIIMVKESSCKSCFKSQRIERKKINRKKKVLATPAKRNASVTMTSPERLMLIIRGQRNENREFQQEITLLQKSLDDASVPVATELHNDFQEIFKNSCRELNPFHEVILG